MPNVVHVNMIINWCLCLTCKSTDQDDIEEQKRQGNLQFHQLNQIKEEFSYQEALVAKVNLDRINVERNVAELEVLDYSYRCIL